MVFETSTVKNAAGEPAMVWDDTTGKMIPFVSLAKILHNGEPAFCLEMEHTVNASALKSYELTDPAKANIHLDEEGLRDISLYSHFALAGLEADKQPMKNAYYAAAQILIWKRQGASGDFSPVYSAKPGEENVYPDNEKTEAVKQAEADLLKKVADYKAFLAYQPQFSYNGQQLTNNTLTIKQDQLGQGVSISEQNNRLKELSAGALQVNPSTATVQINEAGDLTLNGDGLQPGTYTITMNALPPAQVRDSHIYTHEKSQILGALAARPADQKESEITLVVEPAEKPEPEEPGEPAGQVIELKTTVSVAGQKGTAEKALTVKASNNETVVDTVSYKNLDPEKTYTLYGRLMKKGESETQVAVGKVSFKPEKAEGEQAVSFEGVNLEEAKYVVYEYLVEGDQTDKLDDKTVVDVSGEKLKLGDLPVLAKHDDPNDIAQTLVVEPAEEPEPEEPGEPAGPKPEDPKPDKPGQPGEPGQPNKPVLPEQPAQPVNPTHPNTPHIPVWPRNNGEARKEHPNRSVEKALQRIPQTGEHSQGDAIAYISLIMAFSGLLGLAYHRKHRRMDTI